MKIPLLTVLFLLHYLPCGAQSALTPPFEGTDKKHKRSHEKPAKPPICYLGISSGINNPPGVFGIDFNICIAKYVTLDGGAGTSTWGNKLYVGSKYYLKPTQRGWAFGGGLTFNSGQVNRKFNIETINGRQQVTLDLKPQTNAFIAAYHYWTLGHKYNRFYVDFGKSVTLSSHHFKEVYGPPLTSRSNDRIDALSPGGFLGGLMAGFGFSFSLYRK